MALYDNYRLSNSTVVPQFVGSSANELIEVSKYMQNLYDTNIGMAGEVKAATDNLASLEQDRALADGVRTDILGQIDQLSARRDWENQGEPVKALARRYAARAAELAAPMQQRQKYIESLDNKDLNLTPQQKAMRIAISDAGYKGLRSNQFGKLEGTYGGRGAAKNINLPEKVDGYLKNIAPFKGASKIESAGGMYLVTRGNKVEEVSQERVAVALRDAMAMDTEMQAFLAMEGENAAFQGSRIDPSQLPDSIRTKIEAQAAASGVPINDVLAAEMGRQKMDSYMQQALSYGVNKYAYKNQETEQGLQADPWALRAAEQADKAKAENGIFANLTPGEGYDINAQFGSGEDVEKAITSNAAAVKQAEINVKATRMIAARAKAESIFGKDTNQNHVKGAESTLTDKEVEDYLANKNPTGLGAYQSQKAAIASGTNELKRMEQVRDESMDAVVRKKYPGKTFADLKLDATNDFINIVDSGAKVKVGNKFLSKEEARNYEVIDGDKGSSFGFNNTNYITLRNKSTGATEKFYTGTYGAAKNGSDHEKFNEIGKRFDGLDWKAGWSDAAANIRTNTMWMPLSNKTTPDGVTTKAGHFANEMKGVLRAGTTEISDQNFKKHDASKQKELKALIEADQYDLIGISKVGSDGRIYAKVSVVKDKTASDASDRFETVNVAISSNIANRLSEQIKAAGLRDKDARTYQYGEMLKVGSASEMVSKMGSTGQLSLSIGEVKDKNGKVIYSGGEQLVVPNLTNDANNPINYQVYDVDSKGQRTPSKTFNDMLDLSSFLEQVRALKGEIKVKTK